MAFVEPVGSAVGINPKFWDLVSLIGFVSLPYPNTGILNDPELVCDSFAEQRVDQPGSDPHDMVAGLDARPKHNNSRIAIGRGYVRMSAKSVPRVTMVRPSRIQTDARSESIVPPRFWSSSVIASWVATRNMSERSIRRFSPSLNRTLVSHGWKAVSRSLLGWQHSKVSLAGLRMKPTDSSTRFRLRPDQLPDYQALLSPERAYSRCRFSRGRSQRLR